MPHGFFVKCCRMFQIGLELLKLIIFVGGIYEDSQTYYFTCCISLLVMIAEFSTS